ncbi:hypothetical protein FOXG_17641 [Fusarium oxysporum f. sp. lycopersici 4287]|uniref:Uncharacterized protein n=2 Tax=Fusarium oxysporum TaxID=5507 RepID=A0A0J9WDE6_FUSO4|nr:uncharacterized protein FOXG_17641 [Fusarium oxysporum f. sp. lycopersici 4287]KNB20665.1 hypothetical protein FOXG_17641 [Fusarium oxysporum f. sp. lycopersici 4287]
MVADVPVRENQDVGDRVDGDTIDSRRDAKPPQLRAHKSRYPAGVAALRADSTLHRLRRHAARHPEEQGHAEGLVKPAKGHKRRVSPRRHGGAADGPLTATAVYDGRVARDNEPSKVGPEVIEVMKAEGKYV